MFHHPKDGTDESETAILITAATNMTSLRSVVLKQSPLGACIIHLLNSYQKLTELSVYGLNPHVCIWPSKTTVLTSLKWTLPLGYGKGNEGWSPLLTFP